MGVKKRKKQEEKAFPVRKTLKRQKRLLLAKEWITGYTGKKMVSAYAKKYRTDLPTAIAELRILGVAISPTYEAAVLTTLAALAAKKKDKKTVPSNASSSGISQNDHFAYIIGYTSGGTPYGLTWDELSSEDRKLFKA